MTYANRFTNLLVVQTTTCALVISCLVLGASTVRADVKLAKLPGWSATTLAAHAGIRIHKAPLHEELYALSWNASEVQVSSPGNSTPVFSLSLDSSVDSIYRADIGYLHSDTVPEVVLFIEKLDARPAGAPFRDTLTFYALSYNLKTGDSIEQKLFNHVAFATSLIDWRPVPMTLESFTTAPESSTHTMLTVGAKTVSASMSSETERTVGTSSILGGEGFNAIKTYPFLISEVYQPTGPSTFVVARTLSITNETSFVLPPRDNFLSVTKALGIIASDMSWNGIPFPPRLPNCGTNSQSILTQDYLIAGDLLSGNGVQEIIVRQHNANSCASNSYWELFSVDELGGVASLNDSYQLDINLPQMAMVRDGESGQFYAISQSVLYRIDGESGRAIDSTTEPLPTGILGWYDLFGDGDKYLVTLNDTLLEAYGFDFVTDVADENDIALLPESFGLSQPYPNPFNPSVSFTLTTKRKTEVTVDIYNVLGQRVAEIFSGEIHIGESTFTWNGADNSSGIYFIRAKTKDGPTETRKAVLLK